MLVHDTWLRFFWFCCPYLSDFSCGIFLCLCTTSFVFNAHLFLLFLLWYKRLFLAWLYMANQWFSRIIHYAFSAYYNWTWEAFGIVDISNQCWSSNSLWIFITGLWQKFTVLGVMNFARHFCCESDNFSHYCNLCLFSIGHCDLLSLVCLTVKRKGFQLWLLLHFVIYWSVGEYVEIILGNVYFFVLIFMFNAPDAELRPRF